MGAGPGEIEPAPVHGGRLADARRRFGRADLLDLSTGINPIAYPLPPLAGLCERLPDPEDETALRRLAARRYGVPDATHVAAAPGSQLLISLLPLLLPHARTVVLGPTYGEHAAAWTAAGGDVREVATLPELEAAAALGTALVLCHPNNPDGRRLDPAQLAALIGRATARQATLIVDEAFADLEPDWRSAASALPRPGLCVLRSFGKAYGLAGLRLGFLLADPPLIVRVRSALGPWSVSGPALAAGQAGLADDSWLAAARHRTRTAASRLDALLSDTGLEPLGGTTLFRLTRSRDAAERWARLGHAGVLVRRFDHRPDWLRFGLPGGESDWTRLETALSATR